MLYYIFDRTFEGLLTCIFDAFYRKETPLQLVSNEGNVPLFARTLHVVSDQEKSEQVLSGLRQKISGSAVSMLYSCFLSETEEVENMIFRYIHKSFLAEKSIELNFADPDVLGLSKTYKKVMREAERMRQFTRFQKTADGIFFACMEPLYNVSPLNVDFFEDRFADQPWIIYDTKRNYGWYYDLQKTVEVRFENPEFNLKTGGLNSSLLDTDESDFQHLWKQYFKSICIKERINLKLQKQHMPKRFWKYLPEKQQE